MIKKMEWKWEILDEYEDNSGNSSRTSRSKVIGGWLVHHAFSKKSMMSESMQFVADKDHQWMIVKPKA